MTRRRLFLLAATATLLGGCASSRSVERITFPPVKVLVASEQPDGLDVFDAEALFERGLDLMRGGLHREAESYFARVVLEFPDSPQAVPAQYNRAVCLVRAGDGEAALAAADLYLEVLPESAAAKHHLDGSFQRGAALMLLKRYEEAADLFDVLIVEALLPADQIEALVDSGVAHFMRGDRITSEYRFLKARRLHKDASKLERLQVKYFIAQAEFYLAELARLEFSDFKLRYPTRKELASGTDIENILGRDLETKCQLLLRAQYAFTRTIREGHTGWASAAGYKVGSMYEELYDDLVSLPEPDELTEAQQRIFKELLRDKVLILLEKAVNIWQNTAEMATRTGEENLWVEKTRKSLERVRTFVLAKSDAPLLRDEG
jgi:tetratricopeptide (TPR) repeat protein